MSITVEETFKNLLHVDYYVIIVILGKYIKEIMQNNIIIFLVQILLPKKMIISEIKNNKEIMYIGRNVMLL